MAIEHYHVKITGTNIRNYKITDVNTGEDLTKKFAITLIEFDATDGIARAYIDLIVDELDIEAITETNES